MSEVVVVNLRDAGARERGLAGTKAATLAELMQAGLPVPEGFVITAPALARLSDGDCRAISAAVARLGDVVLAVRSSALAEDLENASFAGLYETRLGVRGAAQVLEAARLCREAVASAPVRAYRQTAQGPTTPIAVLVQRQLEPHAAGVAFSVDPVTGEEAVRISAVRGLGERLVSGRADADEWVVRGTSATLQRHQEGVIDTAQALEIAALVGRVAAARGAPQDVEWAIDAGGLHLLQARPITARPEPVSWAAPPGAWTRDFRLGEWLGAPVTPLFASWLLERMQAGLADTYQRHFGFPPRLPHHAIVNGWFFASLNFLPTSALAMMGTLVRYFLPRFVRRPRWASLALPPLAGLGVDLHVRDYQDRVLPAYQRAVVEAEQAEAGLDRAGLMRSIDDLGYAAGEYFASMTFVAGFAWKAELALAEWLRAQGQRGAEMALLAGLGAPGTPPHAVSSLDWAYPTFGELGADAAPPKIDLGESRRAAEAAVRQALQPRKIRRFDALLARAQRFARLREEQVLNLTLPWPLLRRAVARLATTWVERGFLDDVGDAYFLQRDELAADPRPMTDAVGARRAAWQSQRRLSPPLVLGELPPMVRGMIARARRLRPAPAGGELVCGFGASPGTATGRVRVLRGPDQFPELRAGEVLVAPVTTPAWTPLFARAAAVITDTGSILAHASIIAREYGIPVVIGTGDATSKLRDGEIVTVDGGAGTVVRA